MSYDLNLARRLVRRRGLLFLVAAAALGACSGDGAPTGLSARKSAPPSATTGTVASVTVSPSPVSGAVGQSAQFTATAKDAYGNVLSGQSFVWTSSDSTIVEVNASGYGTAVGVGSATLRATDGTVSGTASASVSGDAVAAIAVSPTSLVGAPGQQATLTAKLTDASGTVLTGRRVLWSSSAPSVAKVDTTGLVTAVAAGSATITAYSEGLHATAAVNISSTTVTAPGTVTNLAVSGTTDSSATLTFTQVTNGAGGAASYEIRYATGTISWGSATAAAAGTCATPVAGTTVGATLTCTVNGLAASTAYQFQVVAFRGTLSVNAVFGSLSNVASGSTPAVPPSATTVASVTVSPSSASGNVGQSAQFSATAYNSSGTALTGQTFTWSSSNTSVVTVTASGYATAVGSGSATITATDGGKTGQASVSVAGSTTTGTPASITVSPATASVTVGGTQQFSATVYDASGTALSGQTVTWSSSNTSIATVSVGGLVTTLLTGTVTITATDGSVKGTASLTVSVLPPPPSSSGWANQPAGFTALTDQPWDGLNTLSWYIEYNTNGYATIASDPTAPDSPSNVLQFMYPVGFAGGAAPATEIYGVPSVTKLYVGMWWKPSNPWQGHNSNVNKLAHIFTNSAGEEYIAMYGPPGGPYYLSVMPEWVGISSTRLMPNVNNVAVTLGQWHKVEWLVEYDPTNPNSGVVEWWMDGQLIGNYSGLQSPSAPLVELHLSPTWGGMTDTKTETDYYWFDNVYLSYQ